MCACVVIIVINWLQLLFAYNNWMDPSYRVELSQFHSISLSLTYVISLILLLFISLSLSRNVHIWENSILNSLQMDSWRGGGGEQLSSSRIDDG